MTDDYLLSFIRDFFRRHFIPPTQTIWIAYSGGLDSHALLHLLCEARLPNPLRAVHVNHGLNPSAPQWAKQCELVCKTLGVPLTQLTVDAKAGVGESPENVARQKRYLVFISLLKPGEVVVTAHHQDDQAETFLLQLMRGAGLPGLSSMGERKQLGEGILLRPLLHATRTQLEAYAKAHRLKWVEDDSNLNVKFDRNFVRHQLFPLLKKRWPNVSKAISRSAAHCASAQGLLNELAEKELVWGRAQNTLSIPSLLSLEDERRINVIRYWLRRQQFLLPSENQLKDTIKSLVLSRQDAKPLFALPHLELRRFKNELYAMAPLKKFDEKAIYVLDNTKALALGGVGILTPCLLPTQTSQHLFISEKKYGKNPIFTVRFRHGGEIFHPCGRNFSHPLKKLFQEWEVPPWLRERIPLIYVNDELAAVVGFAVSIQFAKKENNLEGSDFYFYFQA